MSKMLAFENVRNDIKTIIYKKGSFSKEEMAKKHGLSIGEIDAAITGLKSLEPVLHYFIMDEGDTVRHK